MLLLKESIRKENVMTDSPFDIYKIFRVCVKSLNSRSNNSGGKTYIHHENKI